MNLDQEIKKSLIALATIAGKELNEISLSAYFEALADLDQSSVLNALKVWLRTSRGFPYPSDIREKVMPEIDLDDNAQDISNVIIASLSRHGHTNVARAREAIGELGWVVVDRMGGWKHLCEVVTHENEGMFRAQIRDYAGTVSKKAMRGDLHSMPGLPSPANDVAALVAATMKELE